MATNFAPPAQNTVLVDGPAVVKKAYLPTVARAFPVGTPMWDNGQYGCEPALLSPAGHGSAAAAWGSGTASSYTTDLLFQSAFAPWFLGIALEPRIPQQMFGVSQADVGAPFTQYVDDASKPFISIATSGIIKAPTISPLAAQFEAGCNCCPQTFVNNATGFYDCSGTLQTNTNYYAYNNCWVPLASYTNAQSCGRLAERALIGQSYIIVEFMSFISNVTILG